MKFGNRFIPILLLSTLILTACSNSKQYVSSPKELTNIIFKALKTNDQATFDTLVATRDDAIQMLEDYLSRHDSDNKNTTMRQRRAKRLLRGLKSVSPKAFHKDTQHVRGSLTKIIKAAKKEGVNLQHAKFIRIAGIRARQKTGATKYEIWIDDAIKTTKGIKLYDDMKWVGKIKLGSKGSSHTRALDHLNSLLKDAKK